MSSLSELEVLRFLVQIGVLLIASRALADVMKRFGQAAVIGELFAGVLLGRSVLGALAPDAYALLFPPDPAMNHLLEALAWIGLIMLLLHIGLETDLGILRGMGRTATMVSLFGMVIPFGCGLALGYLLPAGVLAAPGERLIFALFIAVAITISAVPVIAKILIDLGLLHRELGLLILAAGIVDDTTGWLLLSVVAGLAERGDIRPLSFLTIVSAAAAFIVLCYFGGYKLVARILRWVDDRTYVEHAKFSAMVIIAFACAIITQAIGIHAVFGAFLAGLMLAGSARVRQPDRAELEAVTLGFLAPLFFAYSGLQADVGTLRDFGLPLLVLAIACGAKLIGCGAGGLIGGLRFREALAVAIGMNARGGMGILVALIGLSLGVLTAQMYTIIILVAVVTSMMTPALLTWALRGVAERPSEAERAERGRLLARLHLPREGAKLLVLTGGGPHADLAAHMAAALGNHHEASITIFRAIAGGGAARSAEFDAQFARLKAIAEQAGARYVNQRSIAADSIAEAIAAESERGYDAIFAGASQVEGYDSLGGDVLRELVGTARAPVVIVRGAGGAVPFKRVLAPTTGAAFSRLGATVAMHYAQAFNSHVTALYVREVPVVPGLGVEFVDEIRRLGSELGVGVEARLDAGKRAERVILNAARNGNYDLLVMGVLFRSSEQRLYFGPKVREILTRAECAVAVVVPPMPSSFRA